MVFNFISKLVRTISLNKVVLFSLFILLGIVLYTAYENHGRILTAFEPAAAHNHSSQTFSVGENTKKEINSLVTSDEQIIGLAVMSSDLRMNESQTVYFFGDQQLLAGAFDAASKSGSNRLPLFTADETSNNEIIKLINGQYSCVKFDSTMISKIYPELSASIKGMCRSGIPSYYGYFSGFVGVFLSTYPSPERQAQLKLLTDKLANDIYFHDVLPSQKAELP